MEGLVRMCGLFFSSNSRNVRKFDQTFLGFLSNRGTLPPILMEADGCLIGHSLLPVQGPSPIMQPIVGKDSVMVFGGELWTRGKFDSDTLYLMSLLENTDFRAAMASLDGMFAVIYYSIPDHTVYFATDPFGEIPLYFAVMDDQIIIASEIKILISLGLSFRAIRSVEPGYIHKYRITDSALEIEKYIDWSFTNDISQIDYASLRDLVHLSVQKKAGNIELQQASLLLSGGIDSAIMAYELKKLGIDKAFTVGFSEDAPDLAAARRLSDGLGLDFTPILVRDVSPRISVAVAEHTNRSIIEEMCCHIGLSNFLNSCGIRVVFTGCGADEIFIGYQHLLRYRNQQTRKSLQKEFITKYHRMDLRAFNKVYMLNAIEPRNPFLTQEIMRFAATLDVDTLLIGKHREMKFVLREAYRSVLGEVVNKPKKIARETMNVKAHFLETFGTSPHIYRSEFREIFSDSNILHDLVTSAKDISYARIG
jgi:asparagine synthase (glutamine-hydrolysing)